MILWQYYIMPYKGSCEHIYFKLVKGNVTLKKLHHKPMIFQTVGSKTSGN